MRAEAFGDQAITVEICDNREHDMRRWLEDQIRSEDRKLARLAEKIVKAMQDYRNAFPTETQEVDASVAAAGEYRAMLARWADDLPRFEARFKELLNENTIREVANFQSQLAASARPSASASSASTSSLQIDYNPGRYIVLESQRRPRRRDPRLPCRSARLHRGHPHRFRRRALFRGQVPAGQAHHRAFPRPRRPWRTWTGAGPPRSPMCATGSSSPPPSAGARTIASTSIIPISGGKSGGQKEKLAYTVLAASLAYQFGLDWGAKSRSFRFVMIDEAFGRGSDESARYGLELFSGSISNSS